MFTPFSAEQILGDACIELSPLEQILGLGLFQYPATSWNLGLHSGPRGSSRAHSTLSPSPWLSLKPVFGTFETQLDSRSSVFPVLLAAWKGNLYPCTAAGLAWLARCIREVRKGEWHSSNAWRVGGCCQKEDAGFIRPTV